MQTINVIPLPFLLRLVQPYDWPNKLGICERLFGRSLARHGVGWVQTGAGIFWKLDLANATLRWIVYGKYEGAGFLNWARRFLPRDGVVVDSGANIGQMLLYLSQYVPEGKVLAFEPGAHQAECLRAHPQLPVELLRAGLGDVSRAAFLEARGPADRHGSWNQVSDTGGEPIELVRLDDMLSARGIERLHLWKLDVEGFEIPALRGAGEYLRQRRIDALFVELTGENGLRVRTFLEEQGYACHLFTAGGKLVPTKTPPEHTNGLFLPTA